MKDWYNGNLKKKSQTFIAVCQWLFRNRAYICTVELMHLKSIYCNHDSCEHHLLWMPSLGQGTKYLLLGSFIHFHSAVNKYTLGNVFYLLRSNLMKSNLNDMWFEEPRYDLLLFEYTTIYRSLKEVCFKHLQDFVSQRNPTLYPTILNPIIWLTEVVRYSIWCCNYMHIWKWKCRLVSMLAFMGFTVSALLSNLVGRFSWICYSFKIHQSNFFRSTCSF